MSGLAQAAAKAGIPFCRGILNGSYCHPTDAHESGFIRDGYVHLADGERITQSRLKRFCLLAAELELGDLAGQESWATRYLRCSTAEMVARKRLRIRLSSHVWDVDRWMVRAQLAHVPTTHHLRARAMAWTRLAGRV